MKGRVTSTDVYAETADPKRGWSFKKALDPSSKHRHRTFVIVHLHDHITGNGRLDALTVRLQCRYQECRFRL